LLAVSSPETESLRIHVLRNASDARGELTAGPGQVEPTLGRVFIGIRDPELKSTVF